MNKFKNIPIYILAILMLILVSLEVWTYYLGTTDVTFKRLLGSKPYNEIKDMTLRRYKEGAISPHLFTITTQNEKVVIKKLSSVCNLEKITIDKLPKEAEQTDKEMVNVIKKSPFIYLSKKYNLQKPKEGRMCLVFSDKKYLYLFINGNL